MLVIMMDNQLLSAHQVCQGCLLADQKGQPRWQQGQLRCGHALRKLNANQPEQFEWVMGFRVANIE